MSTMLEVSGVSHRYGSGPKAHTAVDNLSFTVEAGQLASIVGPSGCGKSTLLRCIAGLTPPTDGTVSLHGDRVSGVPDDLAVVFQDYSRSLFPWLSVQKNVEFPLRWRSISRSERRKRAAEALEHVGLSGVGGKYPWQLSGGMQQRVSIARALASRPSLLLMDEPFASVDAQTRFELEDLTRRVQREQGATILVVTHDIDESVYLSDRVLVLSKSPASIVADLRVDLPADRDQIATRESLEFVTLRGEVARLLNGGTPEEAAKAASDAAEWAMAEQAKEQRAKARR
ncbi:MULTISPECIES: ABC transporter ATP-binding protein [unclassified Amycolatopsis]|uniref:ABC transporter ATP-binding protein n=1 Tax=unclassified Amycolatopsis TaxID=2618356 RepID=UPI002E0FB78A|nr:MULTISPECIES: ABC transporter ATP-binding protein [unclassified Amycolatopsis]WSJ74412.1 ABC transporter ATP-binding protein [Amycolatopsis sp. NBC_01307]WSK81940.1 ABC transporter ATP-binding protein [Amycolatopsis sp. NBC_01286]